MTASFRTADAGELADALRDARRRTLALFACFAEAGMDDARRVPLLPILNPPLWELGHVAWFAEWYVLREARSSAPDAARLPSLLGQADEYFDSNTVPHDARWSLPLPGTGAIEDYCAEVLERVLDRLAASGNSDAALYPYRLALAHEDMHGEAFAYTLQTLGIAPPTWLQPVPGRCDDNELHFASGVLERGGRPQSGFVFDNEQWRHAVEVAAFSIDPAPVSNGRFLAFVEDGGYERPSLWTPGGREWLASAGRSGPACWHKGNDGGGSAAWRCKRFGTSIPLPLEEPVRHLTLFEAQAFCAWSGRRLPAEPEWEFAAQSARPEFRWGEVWEWTATAFAPYQGFEPGPYREYSAPFFGTHQSLRGASFATPARLRSPDFRNYYLPQRDDIFVGFRTCSR